MSTISISLIYPGGSVSQEHLESMSNTALAVQQIVTSKATLRRSNMVKDRHPVDLDSVCRMQHQPVQQVDPGNITKQFRVEVIEIPAYRLGDFVGPAQSWETEYETTWHDQFIEVTSAGQVGSKNYRKELRASRRHDRAVSRRRRKAVSKVRMTKHDLQVEALFADFEPWNEDLPVHVHDRHFSMKAWVDGESRLDRRGWTDYVGSEWKADMDGLHFQAPKVEMDSIDDRIDAIRRHKATAEYDAKRLAEIKRREAVKEAKRLADLDAKRRYWAGVYQQPQTDSPAKRESDERYYTSRRFLVANTRGA